MSVSGTMSSCTGLRAIIDVISSPLRKRADYLARTHIPTRTET